MVNYAKTMKGGAIFLAGHFMATILEWMLPNLISLFYDTTVIPEGANIASYIWYGLLVTFFLIYLVIPMYYVIDGMLEPEPKNNHILGIASGALFFIFGMGVTLAGYFWIPILADMIDTPLLQGLFWVGFILYWTTAIVVTPAYQIIHKNRS